MSFDFSRIKPMIKTLLAIILLLLVSFFDLTTEKEISFTLFYLIPVALVAWMEKRACAIVFSIFAAFLWTIANPLDGYTYYDYYVFHWNIFVMLCFFIGTTFLLHALKTLLEKEKEISKLNSDMVSAVSHDFNNLLTGLNLTVVLLEEEEGKNITKDRRNLYKMHRHNYDAMSEEIKVFLNKSRLESGTIKLDIKKAEIRNIIDNAVNHFLPMAYEKNIRIIRDFPKAHHAIKCDIDLINLAISNLLSNAIKYSPKNKNIIIRVRRVEKKFLKISIKDSGIGIDKDDFDKIFTGFHRTKKSMQHTTGFGVGLKMTKQIIELHNSTLRIASESGEGSEFHFLLPTYEG